MFIIGIEPLLKNIKSDRHIEQITIEGNIIPKTLYYADDVACILRPTTQNVNRIFYHYERMTQLSGLKLNVDKTEIISKGGLGVYNISYNNKTYEIIPSNYIKINGLFLGFNIEVAASKNINKIITVTVE